MIRGRMNYTDKRVKWMKKGNQYALKTAYGTLRRVHQAGKIDMAGETNEHDFHDPLALPTDLP